MLAKATHTAPSVGLDVDDPSVAEESPKAALCHWRDLQSGNSRSTKGFNGDKGTLKYEYEARLTGPTIEHFWPGKTVIGECNYVDDPDRGCWYRAKILRDEDCTLGQRCLHVVAHDGEPSHTYTCPTWVKNSFGQRCGLPVGWQACPIKFVNARSLIQKFRAVVATPCTPPLVTKDCVGAAALPVGDSIATHFFDVKQNQWYKCYEGSFLSKEWQCQKIDVLTATKDPQETCGVRECTSSETCLGTPTRKGCVPDVNIKVISMNEPRRMMAPWLAASVRPPVASGHWRHSGRRRVAFRSRTRGFL